MSEGASVAVAVAVKDNAHVNGIVDVAVVASYGRNARAPESEALEGSCMSQPAAYLSSDASVVPMSDGVGATFTPAASSASILASAVPLPPEMMAPAWPCLLYTSDAADE